MTENVSFIAASEKRSAVSHSNKISKATFIVVNSENPDENRAVNENLVSKENLNATGPPEIMEQTSHVVQLE